ncbi:hypothetical protein Sjap_011186 [Stephania japonica]|uniref:Uncharacterized protein n=1 Tax=Stephania japonica TaxID=461633 RepID=A0AAP0JB57_9MAGN
MGHCLYIVVCVACLSTARLAFETFLTRSDDSLCASGGRDGVTFLWDLAEGKKLYSLDAGAIIHALCFSLNRERGEQEGNGKEDDGERRAGEEDNGERTAGGGMKMRMMERWREESCWRMMDRGELEGRRTMERQKWR